MSDGTRLSSYNVSGPSAETKTPRVATYHGTSVVIGVENWVEGTSEPEIDSAEVVGIDYTDPVSPKKLWWYTNSEPSKILDITLLGSGDVFEVLRDDSVMAIHPPEQEGEAGPSGGWDDGPLSVSPSVTIDVRVR